MIGNQSAFVKSSQSSLSLQILIFFNYHYTVFFFILNLCLFTYKSINFYYPSNFLGWDLFTVFCYLLIDETRLMLGKNINMSTCTPCAIFILQLCRTPLISLCRYCCLFQSASKGNKTSTMAPLVGSLILGVGIMVLYSYYITLMTYM